MLDCSGISPRPFVVFNCVFNCCGGPTRPATSHAVSAERLTSLYHVCSIKLSPTEQEWTKQPNRYMHFQCWPSFSRNLLQAAFAAFLITNLPLFAGCNVVKANMVRVTVSHGFVPKVVTRNAASSQGAPPVDQGSYPGTNSSVRKPAPSPQDALVRAHPRSSSVY